MRTALKDSFNNEEEVICTKKTLASLKLRNLCESNGRLTSEGKVVAISLLSLNNQANVIGIIVNNIKYGYDGLPKIKVKNYMSNFYDYTDPDHYKAIVSSEILHSKIYPEVFVGNRILENDNYKRACFDEGASIFLLLSCMCYNVIFKAWKESKTLGSPICSLNSITLLSLMVNKKGFYENLSEKLIEAVYTAKINDIEISFDKIKLKNFELISAKKATNNCVGIDKSFIIDLFHSFGHELLVKIIKLYLLDPCSFGKGWPDITTIMKDNSIRLIEVKTTDKLHVSQIITFSEIAKFLNIEIYKASA